MSGFNSTRQAIEARLAANWTTTPIRFENVPFQETGAPFVALYILDGEGRQISLGQSVTRRWVSVIILQIFTPSSTGTRIGKMYADSLGAIFDRAEFSAGNSGTIRCRIPSMHTVGDVEGWHQINVTIPLIRDKHY